MNSWEQTWDIVKAGVSVAGSSVYAITKLRITPISACALTSLISPSPPSMALTLLPARASLPATLRRL